MKKLIYSLAALTLAACSAEKQEPIDRHALVTRNIHWHLWLLVMESLLLQRILPDYKHFPTYIKMVYL